MIKALQPFITTPGQNLEAYITAVNTIPVLTEEEEKNLAERYRHGQDVEAAKQLVMAHLRFVVHIARSYTGYGLPQADLIQEGNVGLMKAVKRFDPEVGVRLVSFAVHWIKAEIHEYVLRNWRIVKVATTKAQRKLFFNLRRAKKRLGFLTRDEADAIAQALGVSAGEVREMENRLFVTDTTFDPTPSQQEDESKSLAPAQYLEDYSSDPALAYEKDASAATDAEKLYHAFSILDPRSQDIISKRWLSEKKATLHELSIKYKVSTERIRQLEKNAFKKLREQMGELLFSDFSLSQSR